MVARTPQGELIPPSDPSLSTQYDPGMGGFGSSVSGSASGSTSSVPSPRRNTNISVNDFHADSSFRGGSNQARGWTDENLPREPAAVHPMNPAVQADSAIRGGSMRARQSDFYAPGAPQTDIPVRGRIKADSSIRGGSNAARYGSSDFRSSVDADSDSATLATNDQSPMLVILEGDQPAVSADDNSISNDNDLSQGKSSRWLSDKGTSVTSSANWNASDDLLQDGTQTEAKPLHSLPANDASVGGAPSAESGSASSAAPLDDIDTKPSLSSATPVKTDSDALASPGSRKDLNSSRQLERDITGDYNINHQSSSPSSPSPGSPVNTSGTSISVGAPASSESGAARFSEPAHGSGHTDISTDSLHHSPDTGA